jgi:dTDP-4-amino-4,6-dideoxygalactose transaminase
MTNLRSAATSESQAEHVARRTVPLFKVHVPPRDVLMPRLESVLYSGQIGDGEVVKQFEHEFGRFIGNPRTLAVSSGTAALHVALLLAGAGPGDEVISTPMTAEPTNMAVLHTGARLVWADVDPLSGNMSPESFAEKITPRTKGVVVVHYAGVPVRLREISDIAARHGIPVIEDAAHALGARYEGQLIGNHSDYVIFSFQAIKHMTTGDGGMLVCRRDDDLPRGRRLRWFGIDRAQPRTTVDVHHVGYKYNTNNITAAFGLAQLGVIESVIQRHAENGAYLETALAGMSDIRVCAYDQTAQPSHWLYTVLAERRDELARHLTASGIECSQVHRRNDLHPVFRDATCDLPGLDAYAARMLHIPCGWWVTPEDREYIVERIRSGW